MQTVYFQKLIRFFIVVFATLTTTVLHGQNNTNNGFPMLNNYIPEEYKAHSQNFALLENEGGLMYIANFAGVLEFDGTYWNLITTQKGRQVSSLASDSNGRIYVGAQGEAGFLSVNNQGDIIYKPLPGYEDFDASVNYTLTRGNDVFFVADSSVHLWHNQKLAQLPLPKQQITAAFVVNDVLYLALKNKGLWYFNQTKLEQIAMSRDIPEGVEINGMFAAGNGKITLTTANQGLLQMQNNTITTTDFVANPYLKQITCATRLSNGDLALGTTNSGIIIVSQHGHITQRIDNDAGLINESVNALYANDKNQLWAALNHGIAVLEVPSPFSFYNRDFGIPGEVNNLLRFDDKLYIATSAGLVFLTTEGRLFPVYDQETGQPVTFQTNDLLNVNGELFAASSKGVYTFSENQAKLLTNNYALDLLPAKETPAAFYVGETSGLAYLEQKDEEWEYQTFDYVRNPVFKMEYDAKGNLWLETLKSGVIRFKPDTRQLPHYLKDKSITYHLNRLNDSLYVATESGLMKYNAAVDSFEVHNPLSSENQWFFHLVEDNQNNVYASRGDATHIGLYKKNGNSYTFNKKAFAQIADFIINTIYIDGQLVWFGGHNGLIRYDTSVEHTYNYDFRTLIRRATTTKDSVLFAGTFFNPDSLPVYSQNEELTPVLDYSDNSLTFLFSATDYSLNNQLLYQYRLDGFEDWSVWTPENRKEYTNLPEGDYVFRVKAKNAFGTESTEAVYKFKIKTPYYRRWWAYLIYALVFFGVGLLIMRLRSRKLRQEKIALENIIKERTDEIVQQKESIEKQSRELAMKNEELEKINAIVKAVNAEINTASLFEALLNKLKIIKGAERAMALMYDKEKKAYVFKSAYNVEFDLIEPVKLNMEEVEEIYLSGAKEVYENIFFRDKVPMQTPLEALNRLNPAKAEMVIVIRIENQTEGFLILANTKTRQAFDKSDLTLANNLKEHLISAFIKTKILEDLQQTLTNLKETQEELVRQEKLASVGQLTKGIVDRVINPLNYIVNFSQLSDELVKEIQEIIEEEKENLDNELQEEFEDVLGMLTTNISKINSHGNSATRIVKALEKVLRVKPTEFIEVDINQLISEHAEIAFKNALGTDSKIDIDLEYNFNKDIKNIKLIPEEFSQVIEQLINNAVYALREKKKRQTGDFRPQILLTTQKDDDKIKVKVRDNGTGIPKSEQEKIFEPLFTTKATAHGAGLGLYNSLDIVKQHKGTMEVQSADNEFTEFTIILNADS